MARVLHGMPLSSLPDAGTVKDEDQMVAYRSEDGQAYRTGVGELILSDYLDKVYPVGSIYMSINANDPGKLFGGEWEQIEGRFLLAADSKHPQGETGGAENVTLTANQVPELTGTAASAGSHTHEFQYSWAYKSGNSDLFNNVVETYVSSAGLHGTTSSNGSHTHNVTVNSNGGQSHNNMPPYLTVYMWQRIA